MTDSDAATSARPLAKACGSCARAKVRCNWTRRNASNPSCDRCHRLKKPCSPQSQAPRAAPIPRSRFGQLERKVEELFQTLHNSHPQRNSGKGPPSRRQPRRNAQERKSSPVAPDTHRHGAELLTPASLAPKELRVSDDTLWPDGEQAELLLRIYVDQLSSTFPFVVPPDEPAAFLRRTRPFLFKAMVMAASFQNRDLQKRRGHDFTISLTTSIFLEAEKSLDILQGLLVHIAWYQCHMKNSQVTNLTQLAIAVLADLELNKPVHVNDRRKLIYDAGLNSYGFTSESRTLTNEERRALLCCYYRSSTGSAVYCKVDAMEYTSHMHKALEDLLASQETEGDILLAHLVRTQNIVHEITQVIPYDEPDRPRARGAPLIMHIKTLEKTVSDFQTSLPPSLAGSQFLHMHLATARVFLYEVSLYDSPWEGTTTRKRLDGLWSCVDSLQSYFDVFCNLPIESYLYLPYAFWGQLSHSLLTLSRVCLVDIDGWDRSLVDEDQQFPAAITRVINRLNSANEFAKANWLGDVDDMILHRVLTRFGWVKTWFESQVGENRSGDNQPSNVQQGPGGELECQNTLFMDNKFWEEIMAEYEALPPFMTGGIRLGEGP